MGRMIGCLGAGLCCPVLLLMFGILGSVAACAGMVENAETIRRFSLRPSSRPSGFLS